MVGEGERRQEGDPCGGVAQESVRGEKRGKRAPGVHEASPDGWSGESPQGMLN